MMASSCSRPRREIYRRHRETRSASWSSTARHSRNQARIRARCLFAVDCFRRSRRRGLATTARQRESSVPARLARRVRATRCRQATRRRVDDSIPQSAPARRARDVVLILWCVPCLWTFRRTGRISTISRQPSVSTWLSDEPNARRSPRQKCARVERQRQPASDDSNARKKRWKSGVTRSPWRVNSYVELARMRSMSGL